MANTINVTSDTVIKLIIRRGTDADRQNVIFYSGELGYTLDKKRVFVGDGVTQGGNVVGNINFGIIQGKEIYAGVAYPGDIIYQSQTSTGAPDNTLYAYNQGEWQNISPAYSLPGAPGPLTNAQGYVNFNPTYFLLDTTNYIFNVYGKVNSYTLNTQTASANMITIYEQPVYGTDGVNLTALLSGIDIAKQYTRNYSGNFYVPLSGQATIFGTLYSTTNISASTMPVDGYDLTNKNYVDQSSFSAMVSANNYTISRFLPLSGGVLTNILTLTATSNTNPAVLIKQFGTNAALRIEDTNFNTNTLTVDSFGSVGIGGASPNGPGTQVSISGVVSLTGTSNIRGNSTITGNVAASGNIIAGCGLYSISAFSGGYNDGIVADYITGRGRISVGSDDDLAFYTGGPATTTTVYISSNSNVGIGTSTPTAKLHVRGGDILVQRTGGNDGAISFGTTGTSIYGSGSTNYIALSTNNTERVRIDSAGRVGIGTSTPTAGFTLDVAGDTRINGNLKAVGDVTAYFTSDKRLKDNIKPISSALEKIDSLNGVEYDWNTELQTAHSGHDVGVIAQEVEQVLPEAVVTRDNGYKAVNYDKVIPLLLQAIKELKIEVQTLKNK
jgi:hypothetical protein